jgi:hypothetical protein
MVLMQRALSGKIGQRMYAVVCTTLRAIIACLVCGSIGGCLIVCPSTCSARTIDLASLTATNGKSPNGGTRDASTFGFSPNASGTDNTRALQQAVDRAGTITVSLPGTYKIAGTVFIGSNTTLIFGNNVFLEKVPENGPFSHVLLNKGALTRTFDDHITIEGLQLVVNGVDKCLFHEVYGLRGQIAFFHVKDLRIEHFRCQDLGRAQYCIQVCAFENLTIDDVDIKGYKDGIHLGWGKHFHISNCRFDTGDDAIALNAHDYTSGTPELGWIEDGLVEHVRDLADPAINGGYFCRVLAGAWIDWHAGMEVQPSDTVVSDGRLYRITGLPKDAAAGPRSGGIPVWKSDTPPTFLSGTSTLDGGLGWLMLQTAVTHSVGVRNVTFRDISLEKKRTAFSIHFDNDKYSRSYYPGAEIPLQKNLVLDNVRVGYDDKADFMQILTPIDSVTIRNCRLRNNSIAFLSNAPLADYGLTKLKMIDCVFDYPGQLELIRNAIQHKTVDLQTTGSTVTSDKFSATVSAGGGEITVGSDLPGLKKP